MFNEFPKSLLKKMAEQDLAYHAHDWTILNSTYTTYPKLAKFFNILATDTFYDDTFLLATESPNYAISGIMFHPETQWLRAFG